MVEIPTVGNAIVTTSAPRSAITAGVIEKTANDRAAALEKGAGVLMDVSENLAKREAADQLSNQKISRNADGSVTVENPVSNPLIFGKAGEAFSEAVKVGTIAQHGNDLSQHFTELHTEYPTDPEGFKTAAQSYLDKRGQQVGGVVGQAIQRQGEQLLTQHFNAITTTAASNDLDNQKKSITAQIDDQKNTAIALARQNGADSPEFKQAIEKINLSYDALGANPLFKMPADQIALEKKNTAALLQGEALVAHVDETFNKRGKAEAQKALNDAILQNPNLREVDRSRLYTQGMARLGYLTADAKATIDANRQITTGMESGLASGTISPEDPAVGLAIKRARDIGDTEGAQRITAAAAVKQQLRAVNPLPDAIKAEVLGVPGAAGNGPVNAAIPPEGRALLKTIGAGESANRYNSRYGGDGTKTFNDFSDHPRVAEPITSGPDVGKTSTAAGYYQFIAPTWDMQKTKLGLKDFSPANQDTAAWDLAQTEYKAKTGKDLLTALKSGDTADVLPALSGQWSSLPGGRQPAGGTRFVPNLAAADQALHLNPQERALYERHLTNLTGPGGVDNPDGSRSSLFVNTFGIEGKTYVIPSVWDGKILPPDESLARAKKEGIDKFPSYASDAEANARYGKMHDFMEQDTGSYKQSLVQPKQFSGFTPEQVQQNPFLISAYVRTLAADPELRVQSAKQTAAAVGKAIDNGILPSPQAIAEVNQAARMYPEKMGSVADEMNGRLTGQKIAQLPQEQQAQVTEAYKRASDGQDVHHINVATAALSQVQASNKNMAEHPYDEAAQRGWIKPAAGIDPGQPEGIAPALVQRAALSKRIGDLNHTPPPPLLDKDEVPKLQAALDGPQGAGVLSAIAGGLKPEEMHTLLGQKGFTDSLIAMQSSLDPAKMSTANAVAERIWNQNAALAEQSLGKGSLDKLQAWQALKGSFGPEELAKRLNQSDDPATAKARKEARDAADKENEKLTAGDMAFKMGNGWWLSGRLTGNTPNAPLDIADTPNLPGGSLMGGALLNDYKAVYSQLRSMGVPADKASDKAVERLKSTWGPSEAAGNQLMRLPPENYNKPIAGAPNWIGEQLRDFVAASHGPATTIPGGLGMAGVTRESWSISGLISDARTEAEISNGRPPSYFVAIKRAGGDIDVLPNRITFDATKYLAKHEADLRGKLEGVEATRNATYTGMPQQFAGVGSSADDTNYVPGGAEHYKDLRRSENVEDRRGESSMWTRVKNVLGFGNQISEREFNEWADGQPAKIMGPLSKALGMGDLKTSSEKIEERQQEFKRQEEEYAVKRKQLEEDLEKNRRRLRKAGIEPGF